MADQKAAQFGKGCGGCLGLIVLAFFGYALFTGLFSSGKDAAPPTPTAADMATLAKGEAEVAAAVQDPEKVKLMECMGVQVYKDPQPPGHPPSADECKQLEREMHLPPPNGAGPAPQEQASNPSDAGIVRYTNPADTDFCNQTFAMASMNAAAAELTQGDFHIGSIIAGTNFCESNVPGECKAEPTPGKHICHAVIQMPDGTAVGGNFYVDEGNQMGASFRSDAQRQADGE